MSAASSSGAPIEPSAVDTHCHLFLMDTDVAAELEAAADVGVRAVVCVGIDAETSRRSLEFAESFRGVFATAGVHPHTASAFDRAAGTAIEELVADPRVVAVGETGLDYYRKLSPIEDQHRAFRTHAAVARESGKPLVVHVRDAWEDALAILAEEHAERVVLHCFSGDERIATEAIRRDYFVSFSANVTYPNAGGIRRAAAAVPENRLLTETDSPYLPPQRVRGTPNVPSNVLDVVRELAELRSTASTDVASATARAAREAFPLPA